MATSDNTPTIVNFGFGSGTVNSGPYGQNWLVQLGSGISPQDVELFAGGEPIDTYEYRTVRRSWQWSLRLKGSSDVLNGAALDSYYSSPGGTDPFKLDIRDDNIGEQLMPVGGIHFADGTVWTPQDMVKRLHDPAHSQYHVMGSAANDLYQGDGRQHDYHGGAGDDTFIGTSANEVYAPGSGHNEIRLDKGFGQDTISSPDLLNDQIVFGQGQHEQ